MDLINRRYYDPVTIGALVGTAIWGGVTAATDRDFLTGEPLNTKKNADQAAQQVTSAADKAAAEQKALQDQQEQDKTKAATRLALSNSGFSGGSNTARSFLTTF